MKPRSRGLSKPIQHFVESTHKLFPSEPSALDPGGCHIDLLSNFSFKSALFTSTCYKDQPFIIKSKHNSDGGGTDYEVKHFHIQNLHVET